MVSLKEAVENVQKAITSVNVMGCEDGKTLYGFYTLYKGVEFDPQQCYVYDMVATVDKQTGKVGWMDTFEFGAMEALRERDQNGRWVMNMLDISEYVPKDLKETVQEWRKLWNSANRNT